MSQGRKLVIVGDSAFAQIAFEYFTHDSPYEVVAFSVEQNYLRRTDVFGVPVIPFEKLEKHFAPADHDVHVAVVYTQLNRLRARLCAAAKQKGFSLASYVSSRAFVWRNVEIDEHCFIFEDNTVQPFVKLGKNVVLWSGNHIGHHSQVGDNCFVSSHVVISGYCVIGPNCFLGVNSSVANNISVAEDNWIGPQVSVMRNTAPNQVFRSDESEPAKVSARRLFKVADK